MDFDKDLQEVITTTNRLNGHILGEIGTGTRDQDTIEILIDVNGFSHRVKQVLTSNEWINKFVAQTTEDAITNTVSRLY